MKNSIRCFVIAIGLISTGCKKEISVRDNNLQPGNFTSDTSSINSLNRYALSLRRKNPDSTIFYLNRTLQQSMSINYMDGIGDAYTYLGVAYFYKYQYDTSIYLNNKAYAIYEKTNNINGMAQVLYAMIYDYSLKQDMHKSLECARKARSLYEKAGNYLKLYDVIEGLIYIHKQLHEEKEIDSLMNELIMTAERIKDKKRLANSYFTLGNRYLEQAYLNLAIDAYFKSLKIAEESGDSIEIANAQGSVGLAKLYLREYNDAIEYYRRQEVILKDMNNEFELSTTYTNLGEAYNALKDYTAGLGYHMKALEIRNRMNFKLAISNSLYNIGYTYFLMKDSADLALTYLSQSLKIDREINNYDGLAKNYMLSGKIFALKNDYSTAIGYLEQGLAMAKLYNNMDVQMEASGALSELYALTGNFKKAFSNMQINNEISDSIISGENFKKITQLEMQYGFDKKQNEIEVSHLQETLQYETELKRNKLIRNFSMLFGLLIIAFGIFLYHSFQKSRKADKEKEALLKEIHHRVKNNLMVISSLLNLQSGSITDDNTRSAVKESQSRVKSMALIHQLLYQSEMFTSIDFPKYLEQLMASLQSAYGKPGKNIQYIIRAEHIKIDIDTAIPLGLITNELATNAYKYAFADSADGKIAIDFCRTADHKVLLRVSDNGKGLPQGFDIGNSPTLGLKLVKILTKQIRAKLDYSTNNGTAFNVVFSENA